MGADNSVEDGLEVGSTIDEGEPPVDPTENEDVDGTVG